MCKPKIEGGLGLRRVSDISNAAGVKLIWRLYTSNSLWAIWMHKHYVKDPPFALLSCSIMDSGTWKFIVHCSSLYMRRVIGDGCATSLWFDPWLQNSTLLQLCGLNTPLTLSATWRVSGIISNGSWELKEPAFQP